MKCLRRGRNGTRFWVFPSRGACFGGAPGVLAFPCFVSGLLALPLCGAALTFFAAAKKDKQRKRLEAPAKWAPWSARGSGATGIRALAHSTLVTKASSAPTPHCVRRGRVCRGNHGLRLGFVGAVGFASARRSALTWEP